MQHYEVIICGGGPVGVALALELGMKNIRVLVLEKYEVPLFSPRAQLINARSMEFFMRWKLDKALKAREIMSCDFPNRGIWCSSLAGSTYAIGNSNDQLDESLSPHLNVRVPLWITEEILRNRLKDFPTIHFFKEHEVTDIKLKSNHVFVSAQNRYGEVSVFTSDFMVGCDGTNSIVREKAGITYRNLAPAKRMLSIVFQVEAFENYITIKKGCLFFLLTGKSTSAIGSIDPDRGLWYAQIASQGSAQMPADIDLDQLINQAAGIVFPKTIISAHFWDMQIQLADQFTLHNRIFLAGDSAHGFVPTGALGLNTGFGDAVNLGWKLAAAVKNKNQFALLKTYEQERRPICINNLTLAQANADHMFDLGQKYADSHDIECFRKACAVLAKQFVNSQGATMGYAYFSSPLTLLNPNQSIQPMTKEQYVPTALPGYFLPHLTIEKEKSIYNILSIKHWTLIISGEADVLKLETWKNQFNNYGWSLDLLFLPKHSYPASFILIRPDWHIAFANNELTDQYFKENLGSNKFIQLFN